MNDETNARVGADHDPGSTGRPVLTTPTLRAVAHAGVLVITIDRPEVRNAFDLATALALESALDTFEDDPELRVAVLHGNGRNFSAGMDLKAFRATGERPVTERRGTLGIVGQPPTKPIIAVLHGPTLGGGFEIALACDLIVMEESGVVGLPEVSRGLVAGGGGAISIGQRLPHHVAMELLLTGRTMDAREAERWGLANRVVADGAGLAAGIALAEAVAANAPLATRASKQVALQSRTMTTSQAFAAQEEQLLPVRTSQDAREGAQAFMEKRPPRWTGR